MVSPDALGSEESNLLSGQTIDFRDGERWDEVERHWGVEGGRGEDIISVEDLFIGSGMLIRELALGTVDSVYSFF